MSVSKKDEVVKEKEEVLTEEDRKAIEEVVAEKTNIVREEYLRLEALKLSIALFSGRTAQVNRFIPFAAEVYDFIKDGNGKAST